jgi:hypothetical protein
LLLLDESAFYTDESCRQTSTQYRSAITEIQCNNKFPGKFSARNCGVHLRTNGVDGLLLGELLEHTGGTGEPITRLTDANVDDELLNLDLLHHVGLSVLALGLGRPEGCNKSC